MNLLNLRAYRAGPDGFFLVANKTLIIEKKSPLYHLVYEAVELLKHGGKGNLKSGNRLFEVKQTGTGQSYINIPVLGFNLCLFLSMNPGKLIASGTYSLSDYVESDSDSNKSSKEQEALNAI